MAEKLKLKLSPGTSMADCMRSVPFADVVEMVRLCCLSAAVNLPEDVLAALERLMPTRANRWQKNLLVSALKMPA